MFMVSAWVRLRGFLDQTHHGGLKKIQSNQTHHIQPNPTQLTWIGLGQVKLMGWTIFFIITIIIKLSKKNISRLPPELINKIYMN